jgi:ParB family chromosome partitioning protein
MATNRNEFDDFFGDDDETPVADTRADGRLYRVPVGRLAPNLVNPRQDFGTEDQLIDFGKSLARRQNQPCPVVSRNAYLKLWPEHADRIKDVDYVLVSGERRYRAANTVGLPALDCVANDDFARDRKTFMEAVVSENVDRQNFDPVEEAYAVQALVAEFGSNRAVAQHFERVDGWVTQRLLLTNLCREAQDLVRKKTIPLEAARTLGKLARDNDWAARDQMAWWEDEQERRTAASGARAAARKAAKQQPAEPPAPHIEASRPDSVAASTPQSFTAVKPDPAPEAYTAVYAPPAPAPDVPAAPAPEERPAQVVPVAVQQRDAETIPEPRHQAEESSEAARQLPTLPYGQPWVVSEHLATKMTTDDFFALAGFVNQKAREMDPGRLYALLGPLLDDRSSTVT